MASSLTREKADEICQHIKAHPETLFGQKYWQCRLACTVQMQVKPDRWETRFLAIAKFRVFLLNGKSASGLKLERSFNILALRHLELLQQEQVLQIGWEDRAGGTRQSGPATVVHIFTRLPDGAKTRELALELLATLKHYFPEIHKSLAKLFMILGPPSLLSEFPALPVSTPELPCHNFRRSYVAYCDWMDQPFRDEVIWDIERIYFFHSQHELDLNDFSYLALKDQQALLGSIQFSDFFTGISADGLRLQAEHMEALIQLLRRSHSLKSLQLNRCTLPRDFLQLLAAALLLNLNLPLERLRIAGVVLDDRKGLSQLAALLPQLPHLQSISLPDCSLNEKMALILLNGIHHGIGVAKESAQAEEGEGGGQQRQQQQKHGFQLKALNLAGNPLGYSTELGEHLANLLALNNGAIRLLDLSGTAVQLDRLWAALKLGGLGLEILRLGGCHLAPHSKRSSSGKDSAQVARELFASLRALKELNLGGTHLNADLLQGIMSGLASNPNLPNSSLLLGLDNSIVNSSSCVTMLEQHLPACPSIRAISLRDNSLEHEVFRLLSAFAQMPCLRALDLGGANFIGLKANKKHAQMLAGILAELVKLVNGNGGEEEEGAPTIDDLSLSDSRLGSHLSPLLNALGLSHTLRRLDLSNCELGPGGARLLGKSLQLNHSLTHLSLDRNQIGPDGFLELGRALHLNTTLLHVQMPTVDLTESMLALARAPAERSRLMMIIGELEQALERNGQMAVWQGSQAQLALRAIHSLNNACERYDVNGAEASEVKKVAFHKMGKLVAQLGEEEGKEEDSTDEEDRRARLADTLAERIEQLAVDSSEKFLRKFADRLSSQEGVEMQTNGHGQEQNGFRRGQGEVARQLRQDLDRLIGKYTNEFAWSSLSNRMDLLLSAPESQGQFRLLEKKPKMAEGSSSGATRRGILIRNGVGNAPSSSALAATTSTSAILNHRPVSAMMEEKQGGGGGVGAALIADLMSKSVFGDFAPIEREEGVEEEAVQQQRREEEARKLVHLAKQRPKPARHNRGKANAVATAGIKAIAEEGNDTKQVEEAEAPACSSTSTAAIHQLPPIRPGSEESSSLSASLEKSLEQSPLMQQQRKKHQMRKDEEEGEAEEEETNGGGGEEESIPELTTSPPPPLPKKGTREGSTPPKLPPKPSPNAEELRSSKKKARVFPAQEPEQGEEDEEE